MQEEYAHDLTPEEIAAMEARENLGEGEPYTPREQAYRLWLLTSLQHQLRDLTIERLMQANQVTQENREEALTDPEVAGYRDNLLQVYDALFDAIVQTAAYVANLDDRYVIEELSVANMHTYLLTHAADTMDYNEYRGYTLLAKFFEAPQG